MAGLPSTSTTENTPFGSRPTPTGLPPRLVSQPVRSLPLNSGTQSSAAVPAGDASRAREREEPRHERVSGTGATG